MGPKVVAQVGEWAENIARQVAEKLGAAGTCHAATRKRIIVLTCAFAGIGTLQVLIGFIMEALRKFPLPGLSFVFKFHSSCDNDKDCLQVLTGGWGKDEVVSTHTFTNICDFAPAETLEKLEKLYKEKGSTAAFTRDKVRVAKLLGSHRQMLRELTAEFLDELMQILAEAKFSKSDTAFCLTHNRQCPICPFAEPGAFDDGSDDDAAVMWFDIGAPPCQPWSAQGSRWGWLDKRNIPTVIWLARKSVDSPHCVGYECTKFFDKDFVQRLLGARYVLSTMVTDNEDVGIPCRRERVFGRALNVDITSETCVEFSRTELVRLCGSQVNATGNMFLGATKEDIQAMLEMFAQRKKISLAGQTVAHRALLSPGMKARLENKKPYIVFKKENRNKRCASRRRRSLPCRRGT